jgi:hypothetical protein
MRVGILRFCLNGHWDDNEAPIYLRRPLPRELYMDRQIQKRRLESIKFCLICGSELLSACQGCGAPLQDGVDDDPPQHCGGCGKPFPWTAKPVPLETAMPVEDAPVEGSGESAVLTSRTISAPVGHVRAFKTWASKTWVKIAPSAGKVVSKVATDYVEKKIGL